MLSLSKKSDAQPVTAPPWHPNFRNFERLPDTKVVRTTFFINTAAIAIAVGMLLWVASREYTNRAIQEQITAAQAQIDSNKRQNAEALKLSKVFLEEEKKLNEAVAFMKVAMTPGDFIDVLGESLPKEFIIEYVEARMDAKPPVFLIRGKIAGSPDQASGLASSYVDMLKAHPKLGTVFDPIILRSLTRDTQPGQLMFDISLTVKQK
jgi:hypothetical protein